MLDRQPGVNSSSPPPSQPANQMPDDSTDIGKEHPDIQRSFSFKLFIVRNRRYVRLIVIVVVLFMFALIALWQRERIANFINPPKDSDGDGVFDEDDVCPGFDDRIDLNNNGIPDGCDERPPDDFVIDVVDSRLFVDGNLSDVVVQIRNRFPEWGLRSFSYEIRLLAANGEVLHTVNGNDYILPQETKFVVALNVELENRPVSAEFEIIDQRWAKLTNLAPLTFNVTNVQFSPPAPDRLLSLVSGSVFNSTPYSFEDASVILTAYDADDELIGATQTRINNLVTQTQRDFRVLWDFAHFSRVSRVMVDVEVNIYESETFVQVFEGRGGRFLEYFDPGDSR
jgi:hypothetical protein